MQRVTDTPSEILIPPDILEKMKDERKEVLDHMVGVIINTFVDTTTVKFKTPQTPDSDVDSSQLSQGKGQACQNTNSDDEGEHMEAESGASEVEEVGSDGDIRKAPKKDDIFRYGCELLTLGLIYSEYSDTIKEGDGPRVFHCFKYMLPMFKASITHVNILCSCSA